MPLDFMMSLPGSPRGGESAGSHFTIWLCPYSFSGGGGLSHEGAPPSNGSKTPPASPPAENLEVTEEETLTLTEFMKAFSCRYITVVCIILAYQTMQNKLQ